MSNEKDIWKLLKENADWIERKGDAKKGYIAKSSVEWRKQRNDSRKAHTTSIGFEQSLPIADISYHIGYKVQHGEEHVHVINFAHKIVSEIKRMVWDYKKTYKGEETIPIEILYPNYKIVEANHIKEFIKANPDRRAVQRYIKGKKAYKKEIQVIKEIGR